MTKTATTIDQRAVCNEQFYIECETQQQQMQKANFSISVFKLHDKPQKQGKQYVSMYNTK